MRRGVRAAAAPSAPSRLLQPILDEATRLDIFGSAADAPTPPLEPLAPLDPLGSPIDGVLCGLIEDDGSCRVELPTHGPAPTDGEPLADARLSCSECVWDL